MESTKKSIDLTDDIDLATGVEITASIHENNVFLYRIQDLNDVTVDLIDLTHEQIKKLYNAVIESEKQL